MNQTARVFLSGNCTQATHQYHPGQKNIAVFDDNKEYWNAGNPNGSMHVPHTGTQIVVRSVSAKGSFMQVQVRPSK